MTPGSLLELSLNLQITTIKKSHGSRINGISSRNGFIASIEESGTVISATLSKSGIDLHGVFYEPVGAQGGRCISVMPNNSILAGYSSGMIVNISADCRTANWKINGHKGAVTALYSC